MTIDAVIGTNENTRSNMSELTFEDLLQQAEQILDLEREKTQKELDALISKRAISEERCEKMDREIHLEMDDERRSEIKKNRHSEIVKIYMINQKINHIKTHPRKVDDCGLGPLIARAERQKLSDQAARITDAIKEIESAYKEQAKTLGRCGVVMIGFQYRDYCPDFAEYMQNMPTLINCIKLLTDVFNNSL